MTIRLGVDIGGTFTDLWDFDEQTQALHTLKVRSRPEAPGQKILDGLEPLESRHGAVFSLTPRLTIRQGAYASPR